MNIHLYRSHFTFALVIAIFSSQLTLALSAIVFLLWFILALVHTCLRSLARYFFATARPFSIVLVLLFFLSTQCARIQMFTLSLIFAEFFSNRSLLNFIIVSVVLLIFVITFGYMEYHSSYLVTSLRRWLHSCKPNGKSFFRHLIFAPTQSACNTTIHACYAVQ